MLVTLYSFYTYIPTAIGTSFEQAFPLDFNRYKIKMKQTSKIYQINRNCRAISNHPNKKNKGLIHHVSSFHVKFNLPFKSNMYNIRMHLN